MPVSELESAEAQAAAAGGDEKRAYVQRIFSQIAPRYDLLNHLLSFNIDKAWRRRAIAALDWERAPTGTYVDLCAGTLDVAAQLSRAPRLCGSGHRGRLRRANAARRRGKARRAVVTPVVADALDLPIAAIARQARSWLSGFATSPISIVRCARCIACWRPAPAS